MNTTHTHTRTRARTHTHTHTHTGTFRGTYIHSQTSRQPPLHTIPSVYTQTCEMWTEMLCGLPFLSLYWKQRQASRIFMGKQRISLGAFFVQKLKGPIEFDFFFFENYTVFKFATYCNDIMCRLYKFSADRPHPVACACGLEPQSLCCCQVK